MNKNQDIHSAIDESLSGVRFNASDTRAVLRAVRSRQAESRPAPRRQRAKRRRMRLDLVFSMALIVMVALPVSLFALRAGAARPTSIVSAPGETPQDIVSTAVPDVVSTSAPTATPSQKSEHGAHPLSESEAIQIARETFNAQCDTSVFSFEEYTVSTSYAADAAGTGLYQVNMRCIYDNGCTFSVTVRTDGTVLQYSAPRLATAPTYLNLESAQVQSWFDKYGDDMSAWPQDVRSEFSRRYEGTSTK